MIKLLDIQPPAFCKLYFFGSAVYAETFEDVDIAIIYEKNHIPLEDLIVFKRVLKNLFLEKIGVSTDIILLSTHEETELSFLSNAKTIEL